MRQNNPVIRRETLRIAIGELLLSAAMQLVFLLLRYWDMTVLYGNLLGIFAAVLNFYLMCLTVAKAVSLDPDGARRRIKASQMLRLLMLLAFALIGVLLGCFNTAATLIPLFFPRIIITVYQFRHRNDPDTSNDATPASSVSAINTDPNGAINTDRNGAINTDRNDAINANRNDSINTDPNDATDTVSGSTTRIVSNRGEGSHEE